VEIALFKVNQLGDNVVFLPVAQMLRRLRPDWGLTVFTSPVAAPLYSGLLPQDRIIAVGRRPFNGAWRSPAHLLRWIRILRARKVSASLIAFDQGSVAHLLARVAGGPIRVGSARLAIRLPPGLTHRIDCAPGSAIADWNWAMGRTLFAALEPSAADAWPATPPAPDVSHLAGARVPASGKPRIVIHAGASREYQRWPLDRFASLAARLARFANVTWIDRPETARAELPAGVLREAPADTGALVAGIAASRLFVGNNSGPMHLASALGVPGVILVGPTIPEWDPYWHRERFTLLRRTGLACQPCDRLDSAPDRCLNAAEPLACLRYWSVDAAEAECRRRLDG